MENSKLPLEICEIVIDFRAQEDFNYGHQGASTIFKFRNILACVLTCWSWVPRCRFYLLREIVISREEHISYWRSVQDLDLFTLPCRTMTLDPQTVSHSWLSSVPQQLSFRLKSLPVLTLSHINTLQVHHSFISSLNRFCKSLRSLTLHNVQFSSFEEFARIAFSLRHLSNLYMAQLEIPPPEPLQAGRTPFRINSLVELGFGNFPPIILAEVLSRIARNPQLSLLSVHIGDCWCQTPHTIQSTHTFLRACGHRLRSISFYIPPGVTNALDKLDLRATTELRHLWLKFAETEKENVMQNMLGLTHLVTTVQSVKFCQLTIWLPIGHLDDLDSIPLAGLDRALSRSMTGDNASVDFRVGTSDELSMIFDPKDDPFDVDYFESFLARMRVLTSERFPLISNRAVKSLIR